MLQQVPKLVHMAHILRFPSGFCCPVKRHSAKLVLRSTVADGFRWVRLLTPERTWGHTLPVSDLDAGLEKCRPHGEKVVHLRHLAQPLSTPGEGLRLQTWELWDNRGMASLSSCCEITIKPEDGFSSVHFFLILTITFKSVKVVVPMLGYQLGDPNQTAWDALGWPSRKSSLFYEFMHSEQSQ